jgi:YidC/Oxa1 family membrane protein insertase
MQPLFDGLGFILSKLYEFIPSYAVAIIVLTLGIRVLLLPLAIKQFRGMQAMGALAPKLKAIQQKYKGNSAKLREEQMKLYQEAGVNPLASCLPLLLQFPVLIALYSVISLNAQSLSHIPDNSSLQHDIITQASGTHIGPLNMLCGALQAGSGTVDIVTKDDRGVVVLASHPKAATPSGVKVIETGPPLDCGTGIPVRIPYYALALFMAGTTYYQSRQMQKANPATTQQQQTLTRIMPLLFGVWGFLFPSGLALYWTVSNVLIIGQQHLMLRAKAKEELAAGDGKPGPRKPVKRSRFSEWMERAQQAEQARRGQAPGGGARAARPTGDGTSSSTAGGSPTPRKTGSGGGGSKPSAAGRGSSGRGSSGRTSSGGRSAGSRKKRRKR